MGQAFKDYSKYYDLLYSDKDYEAEVNYIDSLIKNYSDHPVKSIINLGCGTGKHDFFLSGKGYAVTGIDLSLEMIGIARQLKIDHAIFQQGDIRTLRLDKAFDVILSLFHVMSYQTSATDLHDACLTAKSHLKPGGIFIFDCWYGPGVLNDRPTKRKKEAESADLKITRYTTPVIYPDENIVDVQFEVDIYNKLSGENFHLSESHRMRYFFLPELRKLLASLNFEIISEEEWLTGNQLGPGSWNACIVAKIK